jgi:hypothetical protein
MSYDLEIRSDDDRSQVIPHAKAAKVIRPLAGVTPNGRRGFLYKDAGKKQHMQIDPQFIAEGESKNVPEINCIRLHIPYAFMHDNNDDLLYFDLAERIAKGIGWSVYDAQLGEYSDGSSSKAPVRSAPVKKAAAKKKAAVKKEPAAKKAAVRPRKRRG